MLELASARELPIMVFVGNPGCIQIHTGTVNNIKVMGPWLNVMDPEFNLHLREDRVAETWVVRKPTQDGTVTSIEAFTADGENIALLFG
ncbi:MAG TPA: ChuX/HutX family heme-like substrate-binding protein, partial [Fibrobacteria bacterium]|nr:ChuX/HutX family heme-like substrate-binding protein [Fibrobacteria bacterium]